MIRRALRGDSLFSICRWLERSHAPFPRYSKGRNGRWQIQTVRTALRNPLVAGMSHYPYGQEHLPPEQQVLRHPNGKPVIRRDLALITATERERLLDVLASSAKGPRSKHPKAPFVEGLVWCGGCGSDRPMVARWSPAPAALLSLCSAPSAAPSRPWRRSPPQSNASCCPRAAPCRCGIATSPRPNNWPQPRNWNVSRPSSTRSLAR